MQQIDSEQLALFDMGPSITRIREASMAMRNATRAPKTHICYSHAWKHFSAWCASTGRQALPCSGDTLSLYVTSRLEEGRKVSSAELCVAAIAFKHKEAGLAVPKRDEARAVMSGARRQRKETPRQRSPILPRDLRKMCLLLMKDGSAEALRDRAVLTVGFATGLRRSNLVKLNLADIRFVPRKGVAVTVRTSKTDQVGRGTVKAARVGLRPETCPARALRDWLKVRGNHEGPLFTVVYPRDGSEIVRRARMAPECVNQIVKEAVKSIGLNPENYGGHSLRAGFVTAADAEGTGVLAIMEQTGHKTVEMVKRYLRNRDPFTGPSPLGRAV